MSRRVVRVSISLLIVLILLTGIYTVVYGAAPFGGSSNASMAYIAGSQRNQKPVIDVYNYTNNLEQAGKGGHHCEEEGYNSSDE